MLGDFIHIYGKAIVGALVAGLGVIGTGLDDGTLTAQEGVGAAVAFLVALGAVWAAPSRPSEAV